MNEKQIRQLIKIVEETDIDELKVSRWWKSVRITKYRLNRNGSADTQNYKVIAESQSNVETITPSQIDSPPEDDKFTEIKSPMVGTFYAAPAPDADTYVKVGDNVKTGDVLCIVEAMKLMNEIESEYTGVISKVLVENGKPVQYNQPLFLIDTE